MPKSIAGSLDKEIKKGVSSALKDLRLDMGTTDKGAIPKEEETHLTHFGNERRCGIV